METDPGRLVARNGLALRTRRRQASAARFQASGGGWGVSGTNEDGRWDSVGLFVSRNSLAGQPAAGKAATVPHALQHWRFEQQGRADPGVEQGVISSVDAAATASIPTTPASDAKLGAACESPPGNERKSIKPKTEMRISEI